MSALAIGLVAILAALTVTAIIVSSVSMYRVSHTPQRVLTGIAGPQGVRGVPGNQGPQGVAGTAGTNGTNGSVTDFKTPVATVVNPTVNGWQATPLFIGIGSDYRGTITGSINWTSNGQTFFVGVLFAQFYSSGTIPGSIVVSHISNSSALPTDFVVSYQYAGATFSAQQGFTIVLTATKPPPSSPAVVAMTVTYIVLP